jgi:hypothetical protein
MFATPQNSAGMTAPQRKPSLVLANPFCPQAGFRLQHSGATAYGARNRAPRAVVTAINSL